MKKVLLSILLIGTLMLSACVSERTVTQNVLQYQTITQTKTVTQTLTTAIPPTTVTQTVNVAITTTPTTVTQTKTQTETVTEIVSTSIESNISGMFEGWDGDTIFPLTNGQIWQQASYGYCLSLSLNPWVVIYPTSGGYKMMVEGVRETIFVRRLL